MIRRTNLTLNLVETLKDEIASRIKDRAYLCHSNVPVEGTRLDTYGASLFKALYPDALCFPFDGYQTAQGNAAKDCRDLTIALFQGTLNLDWIQARPAQVQNRARALLFDQGWDVMGLPFKKQGNAFLYSAAEVGCLRESATNRARNRQRVDADS